MSDFYLASGSPRRRDLLQQIGARFHTLRLRESAPRGPDVPELRDPAESPAAYVERVAIAKARFGCAAVASRGLPLRPVLSADTEVILDGEVLGKPRDAADAARMLARLAGREHEVRTVVALAMIPSILDPGADAGELRVETAHSVSRVRLRALDADEIARYCACGEPLGKAGAYALQGRAGAFIEHLEGSSSGVVGLPLFETSLLLARAGIVVP